MSKSKKIQTFPASPTLTSDEFQALPESKAFYDFSLRVRKKLKTGLQKTINGKSKIIARDLSIVFSRPLSEATIHAYKAESKMKHMIPADMIPALCCATGSLEPLEILVNAIPGVKLIAFEELEEFEIYKSEKRIQKEINLQKEIKTKRAQRAGRK